MRLASIIRQAHHNAPLSHRWLSGVEAIPLGTLIYYENNLVVCRAVGAANYQIGFIESDRNKNRKEGVLPHTLSL